MRAFLLGLETEIRKRNGVCLENGMKILLILAMAVSSFSVVRKENVSVFRLYVECNHDMDGDGWMDCIQLLVFVPGGGGVFPTVLLANPYGMGTWTEDVPVSSQPSSAPMGYGKRRERLQEALPSNDPFAAELWMDERDLDLIHQLLEEGYAAAVCAGPGSFGSDGWNTVLGSQERAAWTSIVSFLRNEEAAFLEPGGGRITNAFWSDGTLLFLGHSYGGAIGLSLVQQDPALFDAMILSAPVTDWQKWYEMALRYSSQPLADLALFCSSKVFEERERNAYLFFLSLLETEAASGKAWNERTYLDARPECPVLLLTSFRDEIIPSSSVYELFSLWEESGIPVSVGLHSGGHMVPDIPSFFADWMDEAGRRGSVSSRVYEFFGK